MNNNFAFLLNEISTLHEGQASGWLQGGGGGPGVISPWQQDYFATTMVLAAEQGVAAAKQILAWETNFLAGRFLASAQGFSPFQAVPYHLDTYDPKLGQNYAYQTWAQIETVSLANSDIGSTTNWANNDGYYASLARAALAGDITVTASPEAVHAYGWITAFGQTGTAYQLLYPQFNIAPRLPDGQFLTSDHIIVSSDTIAAHLQGSNADQLIYETGSGNVTITGGTGINLLFAGSGNDTLLGGPNRDYLFGGSGTDILSAGAGNNYLEPGTGAAKLLLAAADSASDLIANFKVGIDHLVVTDLAGHPATAPEISAIIAGATTNASGAAVLHLSATHDVTLQNIVAGQLTSSLFG